VIPLLVDQNFNERIVRGLRRREPALDLLHVHEIGLSAAADPVILERAAVEGRILTRSMMRFTITRIRQAVAPCRSPGVQAPVASIASTSRAATRTMPSGTG